MCGLYKGSRTVPYVVEIRRERQNMAKVMSDFREWLDGQRFEPDAFRCTAADEDVTYRLEFKLESEAIACADVFGGRLVSAGDKSAA